jgi:hypothetical protein
LPRIHVVCGSASEAFERLERPRAPRGEVAAEEVGIGAGSLGVLQHLVERNHIAVDVVDDREHALGSHTVKIVCLVKQVPRPDSIEFDEETKQLRRDGVPLNLNRSTRPRSRTPPHTKTPR